MSEPGPPPPPPPPMAPPPGYVAYGQGQYGAFSPYGKVRGLGKALGILMIVTAVAQVGTLVTNLLLRDDAEAFLAGRIDEDSFVSSYAPTLIVSMVSSLVGVAIIVLTMVWMYRMAVNLERAGRVGRTWGPGWAIGGWFAPPVLFVIPWLMFRELWRGSDPGVPAGSPTWKQGKVTPVVDAWWVLFGLVPALMIPFGVGLAVAGGLGGDTTDLAERVDDQWLITSVSTVVGFGAAVVYWVLVRQLTTRHAELTGEA